MARYRVLEPSFIDNVLHDEGVEIDVEFPKGAKIGPNLEPVDDKREAPAKEPNLA